MAALETIWQAAESHPPVRGRQTSPPGPGSASAADARQPYSGGGACGGGQGSFFGTHERHLLESCVQMQEKHEVKKRGAAS